MSIRRSLWRHLREPIDASSRAVIYRLLLDSHRPGRQLGELLLESGTVS